MKVNKAIQRLWNVCNHFMVMRKRAAHKRCIPTLSATDPTADTLPPVNPGEKIGLYLGSELVPDVMRYAITSCIRLRAKLTVLTFQSGSDAQALLTPYRTELDDANIALQLDVLSGEPPVALIHALRKRPEIAFLICNELGYLARSLKKGIVSQEGFPVPVVMVGTATATVTPAPAASSPLAGHAT